MSNKNKKYLDEVKVVSKDKTIGTYAPKATEINGIPTHNIPVVEIVAESPYKLTDYQKAQASKIKDNFKRGQYLKEQDYYNRTGRNKFTNDINYIGLEAQKRLGNLALSAIPGIGTIQPFIKYEDGKFKGDFSKEAFIQSGINTALDFIPVGDLIKEGGKKLIKQVNPYMLNYQLNKGINNIAFNNYIPKQNIANYNIKQKKSNNDSELERLFDQVRINTPVKYINKIEYTPSTLKNPFGENIGISLSRPMLYDTKEALMYQINPRLKQLTQNNTPIDKQLEKRINKTIKEVSDLEPQIISDDKMDKLKSETVAGYYTHNPKNIIFRSKFAASDLDEIHEASHAITRNIGSVMKGRRLDNAYKVLGKFKGYAENYYADLPNDMKKEYQTDEFISDVNAFRQTLLNEKDPNNNLTKNIQLLANGFSEKDINELLLTAQKSIIDKYTNDELIQKFKNISAYANDFVEKYKDDPEFPIMLRKAVNKVGIATGVISTQNNKE